MIKNVLIPENIGSYYIFSKRIIGFEIGKTHVRATQIKLNGNSCSIERWIEQPIPAGNGNGASIDERITQTIQATVNMLDRYDAIHVVVPSSLVVFKELTLPFNAYNKIKMIIDFEIESLLPFSINDAIVDFIITRLTEENHAEILAAAIQKHHVEHYLKLFTDAGVNPAVISVDFFALYGLYKNTTAYAQLPHNVVLIDFESQETSIAYIANGALKSIRTLPRGLLTIAKTISGNLKIDPNTALESLVRFGINKTDDTQHNTAVEQAFAPFLDEVNFTLRSFTSQATASQSFSHLFLLGSGIHITELTTLLHEKTGIPCDLLNIHTIIESNKFSISHKNSISNIYLMSLAAATSQYTLTYFNLRQKELSSQGDTSLFYKQFAMACTLFILLLGSLGTFYIIETRSLKSSAHQAEQEAIEMLQQQFKNIEVTTLDDMVDEARDQITKEEKLWSSFSPARTSMLQYLLELTNKIDRETLGFTIDKLQITDHTMKITAHVRDFEALRLLEKQLRDSPLFSYVEQPNEPDFTMQINLVPSK